ncbi:MAG: TIGR02281 family clan AA aspartic protease [Syntrophobacteraceae bacterium]
MKRVLLGLLVIALCGCATAPKMTWYKPGATQQDYAKDAYECNQQSQTSWSGGGTGLIGLAVMAGAQADAQNRANNTFKMCMEARGWTGQVVEATSQAEIETAKQQGRDCIQKIEFNPAYQNVARHIPLNGEKSPSLEQLTDNGIPSDEDIVTIKTIQKDVMVCREQYIVNLKKCEPGTIPKFLQFIHEIDLVKADLIEKKITWGEYNKRIIAVKDTFLGKQQRTSSSDNVSQVSTGTEIPLEKDGGIYSLQVQINSAIRLKFIVDTGASEVTIPADVALTLIRANTIHETDFLPGKTYTLADGSKLKSMRFVIRELDIGGIKLHDVPAVIVPTKGDLLLGYSALEKLGTYTMDQERLLLIIGNSGK